VGAEHAGGGVQVKVKPEVGLLVDEKETVEEFNVPAVVELQLVVLVLLLKSAFVVPPNPT